MKAIWRRLAARFEALSRRERWWVLAALATVLIAAFTAALIDPAWSRAQGLLRQEAQLDKRARLVAGQQRAIETEMRAGPDAAARRTLRSLRAKTAQEAARLKAKGGELLPPERMVSVLRGLLRGRSRLRLISFRTLPLADDRNGAPAGPVYRHGIEICLRGRYFDLMDYEASVERLSGQLLWGGMQLKVEHYPEATLTLTFYTLSLDKEWMIL